MQFSSTIDNITSSKWGFNLQEAYVFSWMAQVPLWAEQAIIGNRVYYFASKNKAIEDIGALITTKRDTMYRYYKKIANKGIIDLQRINGKDYISFNKKAADWNKYSKNLTQSENNPSAGQKDSLNGNSLNKVGKLSEANSENNPTDYSISLQEKKDKKNQQTENQNQNAAVNEKEKQAMVVGIEAKGTLTAEGMELALKREFESFRRLYPNRRPGFELAWSKLIANHPNDYEKIIPKLKPALLAEFQFAKMQEKKTGRAYMWKHYATWMNQECWNYEFPMDNFQLTETSSENGRNGSPTRKPLSEFEEVEPGVFKHPVSGEVRIEMKK